MSYLTIASLYYCVRISTGLRPAVFSLPQRNFHVTPKVESSVRTSEHHNVAEYTNSACLIKPHNAHTWMHTDSHSRLYFVLIMMVQIIQKDTVGDLLGTAHNNVGRYWLVLSAEYSDTISYNDLLPSSLLSSLPSSPLYALIALLFSFSCMRLLVLFSSRPLP
jgi:hypothetical protein